MSIQFFHKSLRFLIAFLASVLAIRFYGYFTLAAVPSREFLLTFPGFLADLSFVARSYILIFLLQGGINWLIKREKYFLFPIGFSIILLAEGSLYNYFKETKTLLDEVFYNYSFSEIKTIVGSGSETDFVFVSLLFFIFGFFFGISYGLKNFTLKKRIYTYIFAFLIAVCGFIPTTIHKKNERFNQLANNRTGYLINRTVIYLKDTKAGKEKGDLNLADFALLDSNFYGGEAIDSEYPYFHELPQESKFSTYLNKTSDGAPPNIVFLICESLGSTFIGDQAGITGRIMPFLDSLKDESLYWTNFLSICDRTYQVLPASLASVPIMEKGKMFMQTQYPMHFSLLNLLTEEYYSRFYCGTQLEFTNMDQYMKFNKVNYIVKDWLEDGFNEQQHKGTWGYSEKALFEKSWVDYKKQKLATQKRIDVFLTNTTHPPYDFPEKEVYKKEALKLLDTNQQKYQEDYHDVIANIDQFVTFYYLDVQLQRYFEQAKENPDYENTIFIIFGDHGSHGELGSTDDLSNYKVPLVIYSPLLKKSEKIRGVSSHLDIPPTLINYLRTHYLPDLPDKTTFFGKELSFSTTYKNERSLFLATNLRNDEYIFHNGYYMRHGQLFEVEEDLKIKEIDNDNIFNELLEQRRNIRNLTSYAVYNDKFGPHDYLSKYIADESKELIQEVHKDQVGIINEWGLIMDYILIDSNLILTPGFDEFIIDFDVEFKSVVDSSFQTIPKLSFQIYDQSENLLSYGTVPYYEQEEFVPNSWNKLSGKGEYEMPISITAGNPNEQLIVKYFIFNKEQKEVELRNLNISFSKRNYQKQ